MFSDRMSSRRGTLNRPFKTWFVYSQEFLIKVKLSSWSEGNLVLCFNKVICDKIRNTIIIATIVAYRYVISEKEEEHDKDITDENE